MRHIFLFGLLLLLLGVVSCRRGPVVVFEDDFNDNRVDTTKWKTSFPGGATEGQFYTADALHIRDGILTIQADRRALNGQPYTSGAITTMGKFDYKYGCFEIRAQVPSGKGLWPAFWMLPTSRSRWLEIDVMEILGNEPSKVYMTNHWKGPSGELASAKGSVTQTDFSQGFHTFAVDWEPSEIVWYVDGVEQFSSTQGIPQEPMFLLANLAVGGQWPGYPDQSTPFPSYLRIDYIKVYAGGCPGASLNKLSEPQP